MADRCARCDYAEGDLAAHAAEAGHWLCGSCGRSLTDEQADWQACESCLTDSRWLLSGIHTLWGVLPAQLGHLTSGWDKQPSNDTNMPGGDALVLMGPGGTGRSETGTTWKAGDPQSVAFALTTWQDDWLHTRGEPAAQGVGNRALTAAVTYLNTNTRWAAQHHPAFAEYLQDLRELHARLLGVHSLADASHVGQGRCFDCDRALRRESVVTSICDHERPLPEPERVWDPKRGKAGEWVRINTAAEVQAKHAAALRRWEATHAACDQGGLSSYWTCPKCKRSYTDREYAACLLDVVGDADWVSIKRAADLLEVPERTVQSWARRGEIERSTTDGRVWVRYSEVKVRSEQREAS